MDDGSTQVFSRITYVSGIAKFGIVTSGIATLSSPLPKFESDDNDDNMDEPPRACDAAA